ncbi:hypothetical protein Cfor_02691, partial [Coptotermes formosanus]
MKLRSGLPDTLLHTKEKATVPFMSVAPQLAGCQEHEYRTGADEVSSRFNNKISFTTENSVTHFRTMYIATVMNKGTNTVVQDQTTTSVKQIQRALKDCPDIIDKHKIKHLTPIHPVPPTLTARLKIHKPNIPIRPVVNNFNAPSYKVARFMAKNLKDYLNLPNTYNTINSHALAQDISKLTINEHCKLVTYDIQDLYVNIPIGETLHITDFFLRINNNKATIRSQILGLMQATLAQNYFKFNEEFYQPQKGIAMGSPLSGLVAELFLQYFELHIVKHSLETKSIIFYTRYVDDILIIYDESLTN